MGKSKSPDVKETPYQKELAGIAAEKWQTYQEKYKPIEDAYMAKVDDMGAQWQTDMAQGSANKSIQESFASAGNQVDGSNFARGINPNSGKGMSDMASVASAEGAAGATSAVNAQQNQKDRHVRGIKSVVDMGQGQAIDAQQGLTEAANRSASLAASEAQNKSQSHKDTMDGVGTVAGMAGSYALDSSLKKEKGA